MGVHTRWGWNIRPIKLTFNRLRKYRVNDDPRLLGEVMLRALKEGA